MKSFLRGCLFLLIGLVIGAGAIMAFFKLSGYEKPASDVLPSISLNSSPESVPSRSDLIALSYDIVDYINTGDFPALSSVIHPDRGVVFSPYATISLSTDKYFSAAEVAGFGNNTNTYIWGVMDGTGNPISMTVSEYFSNFVKDYDYSTAPVLGVNYIVCSGNALENISEIYPDAQFVELHFPGSEEFGFIDWCTLRLVFEDYNGSPRLTAIIHSESTV